MSNIILPEVDTELVCVHVINDAKNTPDLEPIPTPDIRSNKPFGIHDQKDDQTAFFQKLINGKISNCEISVAAPNEISLSLSISKKSVLSSKILRNNIVNRNEKGKHIYQDDVKDVYDFLEEMQKAVVFSYRAVESFCNAIIPLSHIYRKKNSKGIIEEYGKEQIERWVSTSDKVSEILPEILKCKSPVGEGFWSHFKKLEYLRNEIIHSKSSSSKKILSELFSDHCEDYIQSSVSLLQYFIGLDPVNPIFPLGFGDSELQVVSVPDADAYLQIVKQDDE